MSLQDVLRLLPSVDALLGDAELAPSIERHGRALVAAQARRELERLRALARAGGESAVTSGAERLPARIAEALDERAAGSLREVLNATGVIVHTNLGRAPLGASALARVAASNAGAVDLELDLETGRRGRRAPGCDDLLAELSGAEAACVVNNCAAALLLALNTFAHGRAVAVSRGELVEIGGSFRIPDVCERSGARLVEVGTTNRTRVADYEAALEPDGERAPASLLLKVHPSNFRVVGFTEEATVPQLADLARRRGVPLVVDQGSGALEDLSRFGVLDEPSVGALVAAGPDLVLFSGDKLLGGPQAGCIVGRRPAVEACRRNPLYRALRVGRLVASALEATLWAHAAERTQDVPVQAQLRIGADEIGRRAAALAERMGSALPAGTRLEIVDGDSTSGGGSSPSSRVPTRLLRVTSPAGPDALSARLRGGRPAVVARIADDAVLLDLRTVPPERDLALGAALAAALGAAASDQATTM